MEIKKVVIDGEEISLCFNTDEENAVGYVELPSNEEELEKTQEIDLKGLDIENTIIIDRNDINGE